MNAETRTAFPETWEIPPFLLRGDPIAQWSNPLLANLEEVGLEGPRRYGVSATWHYQPRHEHFEIRLLGSGVIQAFVAPMTPDAAYRKGRRLVHWARDVVEELGKACVICTYTLDFEVMSSTAPKETSPGKLKSEIKRIFELAELVEFEDGMENAFTQELATLVRRGGSAAVEELATMIFRPGISYEIAAQTLLCLGRTDDDASYLVRSLVLQRGLLSPSSKVRDAAAVGIASMNDAHAKDSLARAIEKERIRDLKEDMERVLLYLQTAE